VDNEITIELEDMDSTPCQWILSYGDLRHIGYVQKKTGFIQLIERVSDSVAASIRMQVEESLELDDLPLSQVPEVELTGDDDE
jgi:hypothetical protein